MAEPLHIIFCGTPAFAVPSLEALAGDERFVVDLVVTQPAKPVGRKKEITPSPVRIAAERLGIPVFETASLNREWPTFRAEHPDLPRPDFLVVVAFGQLLSEEMLALPAIAPVNLHASLLPKLRGASPIQHSILENNHAGVTVQRMVRALDAGPILGQEAAALAPRETTRTLHDTLSVLGATLLTETLAAPLLPVEQQESQATFCAKLTRADGIVDPHVMTAEDIDRRVRALMPWPGVRIDGLKLLQTDLVPHENASPLPCAKDTTLFLLRVQPDGKKPMTGAEWERGRKA